MGYKLYASSKRKNRRLAQKRRLKLKAENAAQENPVAESPLMVCETTLTDEPSTSTEETSTSCEGPSTSATPTIAGRRIVDINHFFNEILSFKHSGLVECGSQHLVIFKERRLGYMSQLTLLCEKCNGMKVISTDKPEATVGINEAIVSSTIASGRGHLHLSQFSSAIDIPPISYNYYRKIETNLQSTVMDQNWESMIEAGKEESRLAIENNEVDEDGRPLLTVTVDGSCNAHSGVACIVGLRTGKLLYLGVKNSFCAMCSRNERLNLNKEHLCFKNWSGSSTGMESEIITEGFNNSITIHNAIFAKLVVDGDSSIIDKINNTNPYIGRKVEKIDGTNDLLKNFCNDLRETSNNNRSTSSGQLVTPFLRKEIKGSILSMKLAIQNAISYRKKENVPSAERAENLKNDIKNCVFHVFGDHNNCFASLCNEEHSNEANLIPELERCGVMQDILASIERLIHHSNILIQTQSKYAPKIFNSVVNKVTGGKKVDTSKSFGYDMRCNIAALVVNRGNFAASFQQSLCKEAPGKYTMQFAERQARKKANKARKLLEKQFPPKKRKRTTVSDNCDYVPDCPVQEFDTEIIS